jgi:hypothetical protein
MCVAALSARPSAAQAQTPRIVEVRIGVSNHYKVGHWTPVIVEVDQLGALDEPRIEVSVPDSDGVMTIASVRLTPPASASGRAVVVVHTMVGRLGSPVRTTLADGNGTRVDERVIRPSSPPALDRPKRPGIVEIPATGELIVSLSSDPFGFADAIPDRDEPSGAAQRRTVHLDRIDELPSEWFGYSPVDLLVISAGDGALVRALAADSARYGALVRWVELGGRLVILCGGEESKAILGDGGPLAGITPGKWTEDILLTETGPLEHFAEPAGPISGRGRGPGILVPRLTDIDGKIEVYAGRQAADLPLVLRAPRGLGEVTFAAVDPAESPIANWQGRSSFLQALVRPYVSDDEPETESQTLVTRGYDDLSGALRQRLGRSFAGVSIVPFSAVAALAIAYLIALGPGDYFVVRRWLRKPWIAWVTFPIIVLVFAAAALAISQWRKGTSAARLNRIELIDVDTTTGHVRGSYWAALYGPAMRQFDLSLKPATLLGNNRSQPAALLSSWGLTGAGIGGMSARGTDSKIIANEYRYAPLLDALLGVPLLTSSTKSFTCSWTTTAGPLLEAQLTDDDGLVRGTVINRTGRLLRNVRLLYGGWGYRLGNLEADGRIEIGDQLDPHRVKTIVTTAALDTSAGGSAEATQMLLTERASALGLLNLIMFFDAAGGRSFAQFPSRFQANCDLSRHLELGRAILVGDLDGGGSQLVDLSSTEPLGEEGDLESVVVRFILQVTKNGNAP